MRIGLHVGQLAQPVPGGIGRYVRALLRTLPAAGTAVVPFAAGAVPDPPRDLVDLGFPPPPWRYELWHRIGRPRLRLGDVDLVHAPSLAVPPASPLVVTVHDLAFRRASEAFTRRGRAFHERGLALARERAGAVVVPSAHTERALVEAGFAPDAIVVAPHGADAPRSDGPDAAERDAILHGLGITPPFALAVGTVEPRKGLDVAAAAVEAAGGELTLVVAGPPGWGRVPGLERGAVRRLGAVGDRTLDALYGAATALLALGPHEGFGFPALEAMTRGCPVIAVDAGALGEIVDSGGRLVGPGDVESVRGALVDLLEDEARRAELAEAGRRRARDFTWAESARAHQAAYALALDRSGRPRPS